MGIFQEAAILFGDLVSQPLRKKVTEMVTGRKVTLRKVVERQTLMGDGSVHSALDLGGAIRETLKARKSVIINDFHANKVHWELEIDEKK